METNPYAPPEAVIADVAEVEYAGFWLRVVAALIDTVFMLAITYPLLYAIYGSAYFDAENGLLAGPADFAISWLLPAVVVILFWLRKQGTPGKFAISSKVVDATTGAPLSVGQSIGRYLGYFVAMLPLGLGILWVGFDRRKQGWHDKLAGSVVVRSRKK